MKKVKLMFVAMAAVAVVGGALAFKVKGAQIYCTDFAHKGAIANTPDCPAFTPDQTFVVGAEPAQTYCTDAAVNEFSTCIIPVEGFVRQD